MVDPIRPTDEAARRLSKALIHGTRAACLATLRPPDGHPFASLVAAAPDVDGAPIILISALSAHAANLAADSRCTLLCTSRGKGDPLAHPRVSVICRALRLDRHSDDGKRAQRRFLAFNPKAGLYVNFPDFSFHVLAVIWVSLNGGFGKAYGLHPEDVLSVRAGADALIEEEPILLTQLNNEHHPLLQQVVMRHAEIATTMDDQRARRAPKGQWYACGIDPDGIDVVASTGSARIHFAARVTSRHRFWEMLDQMVN